MNHRDVMKKLLENFTDTEIMAIQGSSNFHRNLAEKYVYQNTEFSNKHGFVYNNPRFSLGIHNYKEIHPKIKIGEIEINAPFQCRPDDGIEYWFFIIDHNEVYLTNFRGILQDNIRFDAGNCFRAKGDAVAALNAIKSLLKGK